tara:strand:+ start:2713 stop:3051 length:339 start_codon:yes stop_codon:yes gene_type:complete
MEQITAFRNIERSTNTQSYSMVMTALEGFIKQGSQGLNKIEAKALLYSDDIHAAVSILKRYGVRFQHKSESQLIRYSLSDISHAKRLLRLFNSNQNSRDLEKIEPIKKETSK